MDKDEYLSPPATDTKTIDVCGLAIHFTVTRKIYYNLTGAFPYNSRRGNQYVLILYYYDGNIILSRAINNNQAANIHDAWKHLHSILKYKRDAPILYIMDNEASNDMKEAMKQYEISYQLAPTHVHLHNTT